MRTDLCDVLDVLSSDEYITAEKISKKLNISVKTARNRLKELAETAGEEDVHIISRPRYGYMLDAMEQEQISNLRRKLMEMDFLPVNNAERVNYILMFLLNRNEYIKMDELCDFLCVSRTTLQMAMKDAEEILNSYHLQIDRRPNYGICVVGGEFDIRRCIGECFIKHPSIKLQTQIYSEEDLKFIGEQTIKFTEKNNISLNENTFENLIIQILVAIKRMKHGCFIGEELDFDQKKYRSEWNTAKLLSEFLADWMQITYSTQEISYIAVYLSGSRIIGNREEDTINFIVSEELDQLAMDMLELIHEEYGIELRNNFAMRMTLNQHMVPFDIRMRYKIYSRNVILQEIKQNYAFPYAMARACEPMLNEYYGTEVSEDELGYFAVIFALGLNTKSGINKKYRILIVCSSGRGSSRLLRYKYEEEFGQYLEKIVMCSIHELASVDMGQVDYVFTTVPIRFKVGVPIVEVSQFLRSEDIVRVKNVFERGDVDFLDDYYKENQFLIHVPGESREEIIKNMCDIIELQHQVPEGFYDAVMKREELGQTDFGNRIAMPHPYKVMTDETFVYIALLDKPVLWSKNEVQMVFLTAINDRNEDSLQKFYDVTMKLFCDEQKIDNLIRKKDFQLLMTYLKEIYYEE